MTKSTITRERLGKIKSWRETYGAGSNVMLPAEEAEELARMALAAMDSEPVAFTSLRALETKNQIVAFTDDMSALDYGVANGWKDIVELYLHAQPAPVVPEIDRKAIADKVYGKCSRIPGATFYNAAEFAIDEMEACRAAMLQAVPLTNEGDIALHNYRTALEGIGHIRRTLEETFGGLHGTHVEPDVLIECKTICDAIYAAYSGNSPVIPDGYVMVPMRLTAENGAKAALIGEFNLEYTLTCHECFGEGCYDCSGEGAWINTIPIDWTTIKEIWAKGVEHFAATPQEVPDGQR